MGTAGDLKCSRFVDWILILWDGKFWGNSKNSWKTEFFWKISRFLDSFGWFRLLQVSLSFIKPASSNPPSPPKTISKNTIPKNVPQKVIKKLLKFQTNTRKDHKYLIKSDKMKTLNTNKQKRIFRFSFFLLFIKQNRKIFGTKLGKWSLSEWNTQRNHHQGIFLLSCHKHFLVFLPFL